VSIERPPPYAPSQQSSELTIGSVIRFRDIAEIE
jgi:hypothetical protein